jgi:peptidyl-prolyl cis-trans isomerase D
MLSFLRESAKGVVVKIFLGILVISFAVWGAAGSFIGGAGNSTVEFGSTRVGLADYRLAWETQVNRFARQIGRNLSRQEAAALGIDQAVLSQVVSGAVLDENARKMGMGVSEDRIAAEIGKDPAFRDASGNFSRTQLELVLRQIGMRPEQYVLNREAVAIRSQFSDALGADLSAPKAFLDAVSAFQAQEREFDYFRIDEAAIAQKPVPTDDDLQKHYELSKAAYVAPEYRKLAIVRLLPEDIATPDEISAEEVAADYEKNKSRFTEPEKRRVQQLSFPDIPAAEAALARMRQGEDFMAIVTETGRSEADIDLGLLTRAQIPDNTVAEAAFSQTLNVPGEVVQGIFGPVILRVTEISPQSVKPLAEVEAELRKELALNAAGEQVFNIFDAVEDARAAGDSLADAAQKSGLSVRIVEAVDRQGRDMAGTEVADLPARAELLEAAFATDEGVEADAVNIGSSGFAWFEVQGVTGERQKPIEEVSDAVRADWIAIEIARMISEKAEEAADRIAKGEDMPAVAASLLPAPVTQQPQEGETAATDGEAQAVAETAPSPVKRSARLLRSNDSADLPAAAVRAGFSVAKGEVVTAAGPTPGSQLVIRVAEVHAGEPAAQPASVQQQLSEGLLADYLDGMIEDLQTRGEVRVNRAAIDLALGN